MKSASSSWTPWQSFLAGVLAVAIGLWVGWWGLGFFSETREWWRGRVQDAFVETQAHVDNIFVNRTRARYQGHDLETIVNATYQVAGHAYRFAGELEHGNLADREEMNARAEEWRRTRPTIGVFYDPLTPAYSVRTKDQLPGFFGSAFLSVLGGIVLLIAVALVGMGGSTLRGLFPERRPKFGLPYKRPITKKPEEPTPAPVIPPRERFPLTGDDRKDFSSYALEDHSVGHWDGYYCEVFLMPDNRVLVCQVDSVYVTVFSLDDVIAGRTDELFDDQEAREQLGRLARERRG